MNKSSLHQYLQRTKACAEHLRQCRWLLERIIDPRHTSPISIRSVNRLRILRRLFVLPPWALVIRVGEIHPSVGMHPNIVWTIQLVFLVPSEQYFMSAIGRINFPHFIIAVGTCDKFPVCGKEHPVASASRFHVFGQLAINTNSHNAIVVLIGEVHIPFFI